MFSGVVEIRTASARRRERSIYFSAPDSLQRGPNPRRKDTQNEIYSAEGPRHDKVDAKNHHSASIFLLYKYGT